MSTSLLLASGSDYKRQLLDRLGVAFDVHPPDIDEHADPDESPDETAIRLARTKATSVRASRPNRWVVGGDQTIAIDGQRLEKPGSVEAAVAQLRRLSGRTHDLHCAVALATPEGAVLEAIVDFEMEMRALSEPTLRDYVEMDRPLDCAGSYMIERGGIRLFRAMRGDDYTAIVGLPLTRVWNILEEAGYFGQTESGA